MRKKRAMALAFTYVGAVVGAGFSSGQEIWRFFARHQGKGIYALLIVAIFFIVLAPLILLYARKSNIENYQYFFYKTLPLPIAYLFDLIYSVFLIGSVAVMLAGSGTIFHDLFGVPYLLGVSITVVFILATLYLNNEGVIAVNSILIPILLTLTIYTISRYLFSLNSVISELLRKTNQGNFAWFKDSVQYGSYNLIMAIAVLTGITYNEKKENIVFGGIVGGILLTILSGIIYLALLLSFHDTPTEEIPLLFVASRVGHLVSIFYIITLYFAMITTAIANYYAFSRRFMDLIKIKYETALLTALIFILPMVPSGFSKLVGNLYPLFGYLGMIILIISLVFHLYCFIFKKRECRK